MQDRLISFIERLKADRRIISFDEAATTGCAILLGRGVKPCFLWSDEDCEYNVMEKPFNWIWEKTKLFRELRSTDFDCKDCRLWCGGSCRLMSYLNGDIRSKHPACIHSEEEKHA